MQTETVTRNIAVEVEQAEIDAWLDLYAAAPLDYVERLRPEILRAGDVVLTRCAAIPFVHFNCAMNLGLGEPATESRLDEILALYAQAGVTAFAVFQLPLCQPEALPGWLAARGLSTRGGWDRIVRDASPQATSPAAGGSASQEIGGDEAIGEAARSGDLRVERVTAATAEAWGSFLDSLYRLPTKPWLLALVGRPGWHHYLLRRGEEIVAVRTMYLSRKGDAWLGIEAPVPGLMAPSFDLDQRLCAAIVRDGLARGARRFVADIEAPHPEGKTPAYENFAALGFKRLYLRSHWRR